MSPIVLDASLAVGWLLDQESNSRVTAAMDLLPQLGAIVPQMWHYELRNALLVAERRGRIPLGEIGELLESLQELPIATDEDADLQGTLDLARVHDLTFYDALYLELAKRRRAPMATLDAALARATLAEGLEVAIP